MKTAMTLIFMLLLVCSVSAAEKCLECHQPSDVMPKDHEKTDFKPGACLTCHQTVATGEKNLFASGIHMKHAENAECSVCHTLNGKAPFTVIGAESAGKETSELDLIKETTVHWQTSTDLDKRHGNAGVFCDGCHGENLPEFASQVDNGVCLQCHGPLDALKKKTEPADHKDRNPHNSHLGDIACNVCHLVHSEQTAYCVSCHPKFIMTMP